MDHNEQRTVCLNLFHSGISQLMHLDTVLGAHHTECKFETFPQPTLQIRLLEHCIHALQPRKWHLVAGSPACVR